MKPKDVFREVKQVIEPSISTQARLFGDDRSLNHSLFPDWPRFLSIRSGLPFPVSLNGFRQSFESRRMSPSGAGLKTDSSRR